MKIQVEPAQLELSATRVDDHALQYENGYKAILTKVDSLGTHWQGKDNLAFVQQIKDFQNEFMQMVNILQQYSIFLKQSAKVYRDTQDERMQQARRLRR